MTSDGALGRDRERDRAAATADDVGDADLVQVFWGLGEPSDPHAQGNPGDDVADADEVVDLLDPERYQQLLGERLRAVRRSRGMRLQDVEEATGGVVKAAVIGSYERGDRAVAAHRLAGLADLYGVPLAHLLPGGERARPRRPDVGVRLAVDRLSADRDPRSAPVRRLAQHIQRMRGDYGVTVLSLRAGDVITLAAALDMEPDDLVGWLRDAGFLVR